MLDSGGLRAIRVVARLLRPDVPRRVLRAEEAPACAGAYALVLDLAVPVECDLAGRSVRFAPGTYIYAGSAYGPGGIRARLRRHFRRVKKTHWHVDWLTSRASALEALAVEAGSECAIIERLSASRAFSTVHEGFGSSDCSGCSTHLLRLLEPGEARAEGLTRR